MSVEHAINTKPGRRAAEAGRSARRATWRPAFEGLERRALRAHLEYAGQLGLNLQEAELPASMGVLTSQNADQALIEDLNARDFEVATTYTQGVTYSDSVDYGISADGDRFEIRGDGYSFLSIPVAITDVAGTQGAPIRVTVVADTPDQVGDPVEIDLSAALEAFIPKGTTHLRDNDPFGLLYFDRETDIRSDFLASYIHRGVSNEVLAESITSAEAGSTIRLRNDAVIEAVVGETFDLVFQNITRGTLHWNGDLNASRLARGLQFNHSFGVGLILRELGAPPGVPPDSPPSDVPPSDAPGTATPPATPGTATPPATPGPVRSPATPGTVNPLKVKAGQVTFDAEGNDNPKSRFFSRRPHFPGGASGVTIGRGYDMKFRGEQQVFRDLTAAGVPAELATKLSKGAGLSGAKAQKFAKEHPELVIGAKQQQSLFEDVIYPTYESKAERLYNKFRSKTGDHPPFSELNPAIQTILVDLGYRGDFTSGTSKVFMKDAEQNNLENFVQDIASKKEFGKVPAGRTRSRIDYLNDARTK